MPRSILLWDFYHSLVLPLKHVGRAAGYQSRFRNGLRLFDAMLEREAMVSDLNQRNVERFRAYLLATGNQARTNRYVTMIVFLWRYAGRLELVREKPKQIYIVKSRSPIADGEVGTLRHFFETVYRPARLLSATRQVPDMRVLLRYLHRCFGRDITLAEHNDRLAADFFTWLLSRDLTAVTVNAYRARWFAIWRLAHERGLVASLPTTQPFPETLDEPDAWTEDEMRRLLASASALPMPAGEFPYGVSAGRFFVALFLVAWWTGLRYSSLMRLRREDVDFDTGWIHLPGDHMKSRRGKKFRLGADAIEALRCIWLPERALIFPAPAARSHIGAHFRRIIREAGLPPSKRKAATLFHKIRRSVGTAMACKAGLEAAAALLGHAHSEVTRRYVDPTKLPGNDATQILPNLN